MCRHLCRSGIKYRAGEEGSRFTHQVAHRIAVIVLVCCIGYAYGGAVAHNVVLVLRARTGLVIVTSHREQSDVQAVVQRLTGVQQQQ